MKSKILISLFSVLFLYSENFAQDCEKLLEGGLYSFTNMTDTGAFSQDLRTYYLSEQFKTDMKNGKWGSSLTLPLEGIPITLGIDFTDNQYNGFRSKVLQTSELNIKSDYYKTVFSTIPNTNLYQAYVDCKAIDVNAKGFIQGTNIETESVVVFTIYYRPQAPEDPMPVIQDFTVQPSGSVISGGLRRGETLNSYSILVTCRRDPDKDLVLALSTDRGEFISKSVAEGSFTSSINLPIGTVITSYLPFDKFSEATKNNEKSPGGIWTSAKSKWAPCDGRPLPYSKYSQLASNSNAPDLRGVYLRCVNTIDPYYTIQPTNLSQLNPDNTSGGIYQADEIKAHIHNVTDNSFAFAFRTSGMGIQSDDGAEVQFGKPNISINPTGGNETRPKSVSVYYYIKIN